MRVAKTLWFAVSLSVALLLLVGVATPQLYLIILIDLIRREDGFVRRDRVYRWCMWWADRLWRIFSTMMRIRTEFTYPTTEGCPHPAVVISNHRSSIDVVLIPALLYRMGYRRMTAVVKREVNSFPVVGTAMRNVRAGFVARSKDPLDLERVRECAEKARDDGACIVIFPEGTVLECGRSRGDYEHVLVPKTKGLQVVRETLPHWPILSITIDWGPIKGASSIYTAWTMFGGTVRLDARYLEGVHSRPLEEWLNEEWDHKEAVLKDAAAGDLLRKIKKIHERRRKA